MIDVALTKQILAGYSGLDDLASALVSRDPKRIKAGFNQMVTTIQNSWFLQGLFSSTQAKLERLVDCFCHFDRDFLQQDSIRENIVMLL